MPLSRQIKTAKVVKRFDTIGQVGWWLVFEVDLIIEGVAKPLTYINRKYATEARANKELGKLIAKYGQSLEEKKRASQLNAEIAEVLARSKP